jgi:hypothetical protein
MQGSYGLHALIMSWPTLYRSRTFSFLLLFDLLGASMADAHITAEQAIANAQRMTGAGLCGKVAASKDEITVCGTEKSKYRLPLPLERPTPEQHVAGEVGRASIDLALNRECGVHRGQRKCNLRDLRSFGYGGGSTPFRALVMLGKKLFDPDSDLGPPGGKPITQKERE